MKQQQKLEPSNGGFQLAYPYHYTVHRYKCSQHNDDTQHTSVYQNSDTVEVHTPISCHKTTVGNTTLTVASLEQNKSEDAQTENLAATKVKTVEDTVKSCH